MRLTERDFDLLRYLHEQGVASARQLAQRFFPSVRAFRVRVCFLVRGGLVESVPLGAIREFSQEAYLKAGTELFGGSRADIRKYRVYRLGPNLVRRWPTSAKLSDVKMWRHQLIVNELRAALEKKFPRAQFLSDPQCAEEWQFLGSPRDRSELLIPDITVRDGGIQIAIEVERNRKSETHYFTRFLRYEKSLYTHVIYHCESEALFKLIAELTKRMEWIAVARFGTIHEVYRSWPGWQKLDEFLAEKRPKNPSHGPLI